MRDELVPVDEFKDAQRSLTASFALSLENPAGLLNLYIVRQLYKFPVDYWDRLHRSHRRGDPRAGAGGGPKVSGSQTTADRRGGRCGQDCPESRPSAPSKFLTTRESRLKPP